ncbi:MAG: hypothetical protein A2700_01785 [Candidatus Blackburnbacteria bacterium RIFCSPHIGHO2_01_FULL_44_64]|uniref:EfeO-type cupredoxin-like domain-containing protein n=1 Tax=Candidatus Blackburnbacteria bacterium RIFCSPHIGHO2_02_FULL_44_20 TaxID=1797516 RepID=A0A1G1V533_9BACT|nr:MAG: hypothetical protein A2700_01785 [Candidatus Blackburnbacteria bacterium RIFCSPHIGHO2_01_FULL_44_64]OGY10510.1 MAG: hypothetical protein A3D26_00215 [Candidatus Blackburnbacteria bacterium RIFCSPHIGHO2_02_FULL_44_20]OGY12252.1 MAG: hypothetical protein A3E16_01900 [Candidatus Blackburnbacteria bacterium RIFCSPHIGHO2_12_FULL_44_25]OGY14867.1 MAG: hypothetical protein A3A62_00705 [Candidatus Blackburnbacteria bacterium RIFCSPLOWO2_01_FULL_44_43]OGY17378.1 MAG: hypothetical protein A3H88_0
MTSVKKKRKVLLQICAVSLLVLALVLASILFLKTQKTKHAISYDGEAFAPEFIVIHLGDSVKIKNSSQKPAEIAVGRHENHKTLSGFQERIIKPKEEYAFTPLEKGVFDLHNHLNPKNQGYLIIDK